MTDPIRWLEPGSDADRRERELIASGLDAAPPADAEAKIWQSLSIALGDPGGGDGGASGAEGGTAGGRAEASAGAGMSSGLAGSGLLSLTALKPLLLGASLGLVVAAGAGQVLRPGSVPAATVTSATVAGSGPAAVLGASAPVLDGLVPERPQATRPVHEGRRAETALQDEAEPVEQVPTASATAAFEAEDGAALPVEAPPAAERADRASRLAQEVALVRDARAHLRRGDAGAALRLLELARVTFPDGVLVQEREVLTIEALERTGQAAAARERTRELRRAFPESPHATRLGGQQP